MPVYTIETTYQLPIYRQRTYKAATVEDACRLVIDDEGWEDEKSDVDTSGTTAVSTLPISSPLMPRSAGTWPPSSRMSRVDPSPNIQTRTTPRSRRSCADGGL